MVQLLRTAKGEIVNLAALKTARFRERGQLVDEASETYSPTLLLSFAGKGPEVPLHGDDATRVWRRLNAEAHAEENVSRRLSDLIDVTDALSTKTKILAGAARVLASVLQDLLERELKERKKEHVTPSRPMPPW